MLVFWLGPLSVCQQYYRTNYWADVKETWWKGVAWAKGERILFWRGIQIKGRTGIMSHLQKEPEQGTVLGDKAVSLQGGFIRSSSISWRTIIVSFTPVLFLLPHLKLPSVKKRPVITVNRFHSIMLGLDMWRPASYNRKPAALVFSYITLIRLSSPALCGHVRTEEHLPHRSLCCTWMQSCGGLA